MGVAEFRMRFFKSHGELKEGVKSRDNYRCVDCGITEKDHFKAKKRRLHVHRLIRHSPYSECLSITVCSDCHWTRHRKRRDLRNTESDSIWELTLLVNLMAEKLARQYGKTPPEFADILLSPRRRVKLKKPTPEFVYEG